MCKRDKTAENSSPRLLSNKSFLKKSDDLLPTWAPEPPLTFVSSFKKGSWGNLFYFYLEYDSVKSFDEVNRFYYQL